MRTPSSRTISTRTAVAFALIALCVIPACEVVRVNNAPPEPRCAKEGRRQIGIVSVDGNAGFINGQPLASSEQVCEGDEVSTGAHTSARVDLMGGGYVQLDENTDPFFLLAEGGCIIIRMLKGQAYVDAKTACVQTEKIDTQLHSAINIEEGAKRTRLTVLEGTVEFRVPTQPPLTAGQQLILKPGQPPRVKKLSKKQLARVIHWRQRYFGATPGANPAPPTDKSEAPKAEPKPAPEANTNESLATLRGAQIVVPGRIEFQPGTATFATGTAGEETDEALRQLILFLQEHPEFTKVAIEAHTEDLGGGGDTSQKLSEDRAFAVQRRLVAAGVSAKRLTAAGFGASKPIADNSTEEGRNANRRIEFRVVEENGKPYQGG